MSSRTDKNNGYSSIKKLVAEVVKLKKIKMGVKKELSYKIKDKQTFKQIKEKCNSELTDIVTGPMNINELHSELAKIMYHRSPEYVVILIEKDKTIQKLRSTIYITHEDFNKYIKRYK
jgi:hypothetical protein